MSVLDTFKIWRIEREEIPRIDKELNFLLSVIPLNSKNALGIDQKISGLFKDKSLLFQQMKELQNKQNVLSTEYERSRTAEVVQREIDLTLARFNEVYKKEPKSALMDFLGSKLLYLRIEMQNILDMPQIPTRPLSSKPKLTLKKDPLALKKTTKFDPNQRKMYAFLHKPKTLIKGE